MSTLKEEIHRVALGLSLLSAPLAIQSCAPESTTVAGELRTIESAPRSARIKGSASWSKWCGPLGVAVDMKVTPDADEKAALPCPTAIQKSALKALYPEDMWPKITAPGESAEVVYEAALSLKESTSVDTQCCYSVKHALAPAKRAP